MNNRQLNELSAAYAAEAINLEELAERSHKRWQAAKAAGDEETALCLRRLREEHLQQREDLLRLSLWLRNYYDKNSTLHTKQEGTDHA